MYCRPPTKDESTRRKESKKMSAGGVSSGPCPVDLTDGPRVGDPCNAYNEWDLAVRLAYGREHEGGEGASSSEGSAECAALWI